MWYIWCLNLRYCLWYYDKVIISGLINPICTFNPTLTLERLHFFLSCKELRIRCTTITTRKKRIRISFLNNLTPNIQPVLKVSGTKCFITSVKIISTKTAYGVSYYNRFKFLSFRTDFIKSVLFHYNN
jgi:hypothetical protein